MPNILLHYLTFRLHYLNISFVKVVEKNVRYWRVNVGHYGEEMLGTKEKKKFAGTFPASKISSKFVFKYFPSIVWGKGNL